MDWKFEAECIINHIATLNSICSVWCR